MTNCILAYCIVYYAHIVHVHMFKPFAILIIKDISYLYYNIITVYKLDLLIDFVILKILI